MTATLLPCPFCWSHRLVNAVRNIKFLWAVRCVDCGCQGPSESTEGESRTKWNRRPLSAVQSEAMRLAIRAVQHIEYEYPAEEATHAAARAVLEGMIEGGQHE